MSKKGGKKWITLAVIAVLAAAGYFFYQKFFGSIHLNKNYTFIYVDSDDEFDDVIDDINSEDIIKDIEAFKWLAKKMDLDKNIHPGKYRLTNGMSMRQIVNLIKYNKQEKIKLTYNSQIKTLDDFVSYTAEKLELTDSDLEDYLADDKKLEKDFGLDPDNAFALIVPGVYEVSWAISTEDLFDLLKKKYRQVWNENRTALAKKMGYSIPEIITLASIVQNESGIESEEEKIAGVYINRLKSGMPLQADPTLRFATKKFDAQRFYNSDKDNNSPYNTYKYKGLPPGPVCLVGTQAIDATLNYQKHKYMFFCAKCELNGYSDFSVTYEQHKKFADAYQKEMDKRGIH
jgi:UPF0755 protein